MFEENDPPPSDRYDLNVGCIRPGGTTPRRTDGRFRRRRAAVDTRLDPDSGPARRLRVVAQDDGDEVLRLLILAVLAKAERPMDAEEMAQRLSAIVGVRLVPTHGH